MARFGDIYSMKSARVVTSSDTFLQLTRIEADTQDIQAKLVVIDNEIAELRAEQTQYFNTLNDKLDIIIINTTP